MMEEITPKQIREWSRMESTSIADLWEAYEEILSAAQRRIGNRLCPACEEYGICGSWPPERPKENE